MYSDGVTPESLHPGCRACIQETKNHKKIPRQVWSEGDMELFKAKFYEEGNGGLAAIPNPRGKITQLGSLGSEKIQSLLYLHIATKHSFHSILVRIRLIFQKSYNVQNCSYVVTVAFGVHLVENFFQNNQ